MADHDKSRGLFGEISLQPLNGFHIEVVGGLVEQEKVGILKQDFAQGDAHLPSAGVVRDGAFCSFRCEANGGKQFVDPSFQFVAVQGFKAGLQPSELVNQLVEMLRVLSCFV